MNSFLALAETSGGRTGDCHDLATAHKTVVAPAFQRFRGFPAARALILALLLRRRAETSRFPLRTALWRNSLLPSSSMGFLEFLQGPPRSCSSACMGLCVCISMHTYACITYIDTYIDTHIDTYIDTCKQCKHQSFQINPRKEAALLLVLTHKLETPPQSRGWKNHARECFLFFFNLYWSSIKKDRA